jgi:hypothetical protein
LHVAHSQVAQLHVPQLQAVQLQLAHWQVAQVQADDDGVAAWVGAGEDIIRRLQKSGW